MCISYKIDNNSLLLLLLSVYPLPGYVVSVFDNSTVDKKYVQFTQ